MLITRTPLRISIGGGGTDLPSYYRNHGGFVISAAISKYVFIGINRTFSDDYFLKYSALERVSSISEIQHPIVREALELHKLEPAVEIVSLADIPAGTGLGSSGSFTVGLLGAIHGFRREHISTQDLAEEACHIEMNLLGYPIGKQDQYIAAFGGLTCFDLQPDGHVVVSPLQMPTKTLEDLEDHLSLFFTGYSRSSGTLLTDQAVRTEKEDPKMVENLHLTKEIGIAIKKALEAGDIVRFGELMHEHWLHKRERSQGMSNPCIDHWYEVGRANGAIGGKLIGAGGGGFLLFYARDRERLQQAMAREGLEEVRFRFDHDGSQVICRN